MALIVHKYGGTSLADADAIRRCAAGAAVAHRAGDRIVVVVSAMAGETDRLLGIARQLSSRPPLRELDTVLAAGEQVSIGLFAIALAEHGIETRSYTGAQLPIETDAAHGKARIRRIVTAALREDLQNGIVPVIAGFQGVDDQGDITTLGRGGSDTTAVALAAVLEADECRIYTDVDGVYTTDPRVVPEARQLAQITFEEMLELSSLGSKVLQIRAVEFAGKYRVPLRVLSNNGQGRGTLVTYEESAMEAPLVSGVAFMRDEAEITAVGMPERADAALHILGPIAEANIEVDMIVQNIARAGRFDFTFTVHRSDYRAAMDILAAQQQSLGIENIVGNNRVAKISAVGVGMRSHAGVATRMFAALAREGVEIGLIATSEIKISVLVDERCLELAVRVLHDAFHLGEKSASTLDISTDLKEPNPVSGGLSR